MTTPFSIASSRRGFLTGAALGAAGLAIARVPLVQARDAVAPARAFGAVGDGRSDDTAALTEALNSGQVIDGQGGAFSVSGDVKVGRRFKGLRNAQLIQTIPGGEERRTLQIQEASNFVLDGVSVSRGGNGSEQKVRTGIDKTGGIFVMRCHDFTLRNLTVSGGGIGSAIAAIDCSNFTASDINVSRLWYRLAQHPSDDAIHGLFLARCSSFTVSRANISDIGGTDGRTQTHNNNRGIAITGCTSFRIVAPDIRRVGQGMDVSGSLGNRLFEIVDGLAEDCFTYGFKFANTAQDGTIRNSIARRSGLGGFVVSGPSSQGLKRMPHSVTFESCVADDVKGDFHNGSSFGFGVLRAKFEPSYPRDVLFRNCTATCVSDGHRMQYGFRNDIPAEMTGGQPNRVIGCRAEGYSEAAFRGF